MKLSIRRLEFARAWERVRQIQVKRARGMEGDMGKECVCFGRGGESGDRGNREGVQVREAIGRLGVDEAY